MDEGKSDRANPQFAIFRARDAVPLEQSDVMYGEPITEVEAEGSRRVAEAGFMGGHEAKVLFSLPGMSLAYVWFKSGFPLPRHSHNADCLYYIVGGSLRIGHEELGVGDGFFVGDGVPYAYTPGPDGVEVLEFRTSSHFNIKMLANNPAFWNRAVEAVKTHKDAWVTENTPPSAKGR